MIVVTVFCIGLAGKLNYDWYRQKWLVAEWVAPVVETAASEAADPLPRWRGNNPPQPPGSLPAEQQLKLLKFGFIELDTSVERYAALSILSRTFPAEITPAARELVSQCRHSDEQAMLLHLISLSRDRQDIPLIAGYLDSPSSTLRGAAAESIGYIRNPAYGFAPGFMGSRTRLNSVPPVDVSAIVSEIREDEAEERKRSEVPARLRERLEAVMLQGAAVEERTAAARGLLTWPPTSYSLRLAEWGVWLDDGTSLQVTKSVLDVSCFPWNWKVASIGLA
jgi:hypothetical protein